MTPTPEQIEAAQRITYALNAIPKIGTAHAYAAYIRIADLETAVRALTAAAGVGENPLIELHRNDLEAEAATTSKRKVRMGFAGAVDQTVNDAVDAAIERCAQVADDYDKEYLGHPTVAAAIRALKDKP